MALVGECPVRDHPGSHFIPEIPASSQFGGLFDGERSRADEAHVSFEDIDQLRKFIKAGLGKEFTDSHKTWIITHFEGWKRGFIVLVEFFLVLICPSIHGAKFKYREDCFVLSDPFLDKDNRPADGDQDAQTDHECDRK